MKYLGILILLVAMCCMNTPTQMSSQVTGDACSCSTGCNFTQSCTPVGNCVKENVALGRPANMSSSWGEEHPSGPACVAVNGNTGTVYKPLVNGEQNPNCIHTGRDDFNAWWLVKLDRNYTVTNITVYIRSEQPQRMAGVVITVDDQECYKFSSDLQSLPSKTDVSCSPPRKGSVLKFYKNGTQDYLLNFCEVQVWVCRNGSYGFDCNNTCGSCRDSLPCNDTNGACLNGCLDGFIGPLCKEICKNGTYGSNCTNKCGQCKNGNNCNASNGVCLNGCEEGYELPLCKEICKNGTYGSNCTNKCGQCKHGNNCNASNGVCLNGCEEGYELPLCKEMCRNGSYGSDCNNTCGSCGDGRPCNASNGVCLDGCLDGFMQPLCKERCNERFYGSNCTQVCGHCNETSMCDFQTGKCLHGCQSGWREPMCTAVETTASTTQVTTSHGHHDITCTESRMEFSIPLSSPHTSETATLSDPNCQINLTRTHVRGGVDLNSCGTTVQFQNDSVIFRNAIIFSAPASSSLDSNGSDVSQFQDIIPIECVYNRIATVHLSYMPVVRRVLFTESGVGQFSFNIQQFWDASFTSVVSDRAYPLRLEQDADIFIQLSVGSEGQPVAGHKEIGMEVQQCLVSPSSSVIEAQLHYYPLIQDGCPASSDVHIIPNTNASDSTVMRFRFRAVNFFDPSSSSSSSLVFVHCRMGLCLTGSCKPSAWTCLTPPARRVRRDVDQSRRAAHQLSTGPFLIMADEASASSSSTTATVMAVVSTSVATVAIVVAAIALIALRRRRTTARN